MLDDAIHRCEMMILHWFVKIQDSWYSTYIRYQYWKCAGGLGSKCRQTGNMELSKSVQGIFRPNKNQANRYCFFFRFILWQSLDNSANIFLKNVETCLFRLFVTVFDLHTLLILAIFWKSINGNLFKIYVCRWWS